MVDMDKKIKDGKVFSKSASRELELKNERGSSEIVKDSPFKKVEEESVESDFGKDEIKITENEADDLSDLLPKRKRYMIYPDNHKKEVWDLFMTIILLISCVVTPVEIAFEADISHAIQGIQIFDWAMDVLFLADMVVIFISAQYTEEYEIIDNRTTIACGYLKGWFMVDLLSCVPFDILLNHSSYNKLIRVARISKLYKLVKLTKLLRILKIIKD